MADPQTISPARRWAITLSVMMVTVMQVLDTSVTNVALPHMQGSLSAGIEEMSWVITSFLAANAIVIPATGWLSARFGRRRFFLICTVLFTVSSFLSGIAPNLGPTLGGWIADNWSWRWIFYINLPIGLVGFLMVSVFLFDNPFVKKPSGIDLEGLVLMVLGFGVLQLVLDLGEKKDWFDSGLIVGLLMVAVCAIVGFLIRELMAAEPILDLSVFNDRNFAVGTMCIALVGLGLNSSVLLVALYSQKILAWDAWNAGLVLAPGGLGTMIALLISGRLVARAD